MFKWFNKQPSVPREEFDYAKTTSELRARIAALRSRCGWDEESNKDTTPKRELPKDCGVYKDEPPRHNDRAAEIDAMKAKLMRKKS